MKVTVQRLQERESRIGDGRRWCRSREVGVGWEAVAAKAKIRRKDFWVSGNGPSTSAIACCFPGCTVAGSEARISAGTPEGNVNVPYSVQGAIIHR